MVASRLLQRGGVTRAIDHEQQLPGLHRLIVVDQHLRNQPADVRRHAHDIGADMAVARPRIGLVSAPQPECHEDGEGDDDQGGGPAREGGDDTVHG
jgi:hypothetical protein